MRFREVTERYRLEKILRSTRAGTVLRGVDSQTDQAVAVKMITVGPSTGLGEGAPRLEALASALATVRHPSLPALLDSGFTPDGSAFLVFPYLDGRSFETMTGEAPAEILALLLQALDGVEALAVRGLAHHNLAPDNLYVTETPEGPQVKLLGLGTPIFQAPDGAHARFRAPELEAGGPADWRADLYSFALTACRVLGATESLADGRDPVVQMPFALSFELENAEGIRQVLEGCLRRNPAERPAPAVIRAAFRPALGGAATDWQEKTSPILFPEAAPALTPPSIPASIPVAAPQATQPPVFQPPAAPLAPAPELTVAAASFSPAQAAPVTSPPPLSVGTVGPVGAAASAPAPSPEADPDGELFPSITDDVLNALPEDWQPAAPSSPARPARVLPFMGKGQKETEGADSPVPAPAEGNEEAAQAASGPPGGLLHRPTVLGLLVVVLLLAVAALAWLFLRPASDEAAAPAVAVQTAPPVPPRKPALERLEEARALMAAGDDAQALEVLRSITAADQAELSAEACALLSQMEQTLALSAAERLPEDLKAGLGGDLGRLRNAVSAGSTSGNLPPADLPATLQGDLGRARQAVDLYAQAEEAARAGQHVVVLERFAALEDLIPRLDDPQDLRDKAAAAIEAEAKGLVEAGQYEPALARLKPIQSTWPDRPGLAESVASYQAYQREEQSQKTLLEKLPAIERRRKPHEGLEALEGVAPVPHLVARFAEIRKRLETQLAQLDQQPPQVVLRDGFYLEYSRGTVANLSFRVTDDYEVRTVKMMARPEGGKMREVPLKKTTFGYDATIDPGLHQNGTVDLYVTATDRSGHEGSYGTRDKPMQLKRSGGARF